MESEAAVIDRWYDHTDDPNSSVALDLQSALLKRTRRPPVDKRAPYLVELARDRRVLDVGCVDHSARSASRAAWLHKDLAAVAARCVGVDVLPEDVAALTAEGYDMRVCDITTDVLDETFDLIIAGEVIEHVASPQALVDNCARMLAPGGRLVITTPNPFALHRFWRGARGEIRDNVDHVGLFSPANIAELAARAGLVLDAWRGVRIDKSLSTLPRLKAMVRAVLVATLFTEEVVCETLVCECVRPVA